MSSESLRGLALLAMFVGSAVLVISGFNDWVLLKGSAEIPMQYLGFAIGAAALLGASGVNIWAGGPLDPNADPSA